MQIDPEAGAESPPSRESPEAERGRLVGLGRWRRRGRVWVRARTAAARPAWCTGRPGERGAPGPRGRGLQTAPAAPGSAPRSRALGVRGRGVRGPSAGRGLRVVRSVRGSAPGGGGRGPGSGGESGRGLGGRAQGWSGFPPRSLLGRAGVSKGQTGSGVWGAKTDSSGAGPGPLGRGSEPRVPGSCLRKMGSIVLPASLG